MNKIIPWIDILNMSENAPRRNNIKIDTVVIIWWYVNFFYKNLISIAPTINPADLQKNKKEYYVYGLFVNYEIYGINGPNPVITEP